MAIRETKGALRVTISEGAVYVTAVDSVATIGLSFNAPEARGLARALDNAASELERS